ncbi:hypothetical protein M902_0414 [Bacteriovorax sp. BAL6_X]|uniref:hypothetical protein n=1 Tax=Bacteriovorax sp. BAL6_X TaxID=1201290 RepID=UPI000386B0F1|nr:hypothetical protein [Bacteriovorax sp. BAL6_X]EPZ49611.1 hypothetical protein M902_0414 [Bacteriovorax sp. BAL6_X]
MKKFKLLMVLTIASMLVTSCGQDSKSSSGGYYSGWGNSGSGSNTGSTGMDSQGQALFDSIINSGVFNCTYGQDSNNMFNNNYLKIGNRRGTIVANVQGGNSYNNSTVAGNIQEGMLPNESNQHFVGVNGFGDFVIFTKVLSGNNVVGYNMRLSLCSRYFSYQNYNFPIIADERGLQGVQLKNAVTLDSPTNCPAGTVDAAHLLVVADYYQYSQPFQGQLDPVGINVSFSTPCL